MASFSLVLLPFFLFGCFVFSLEDDSHSSLPLPPVKSGSPALTQAFVDELNASPRSWTAAMNPIVASMSIEEVQQRFLMMPPPIISDDDLSPRTKKTPLAHPNLVDIPTNFDVYTKWPACSMPAQAQGNCGASWGISIADAMSDRLCILRGSALRLSAQDFISCDPNGYGCQSAFIAQAWTYLEKTGIVTEICYPYIAKAPACPYKCDGTVPGLIWDAEKHFSKPNSTTHFDPTDLETVLSDLVSHGSIMAVMTVCDEFLSYKEGVYDCYCGGRVLGATAVKLQGFGVDSDSGKPYWVGVTAFGKEWGMKGYFWIGRGGNLCSIEQQMYAATPKIAKS